jgi:hypothetical protein
MTNALKFRPLRAREVDVRIGSMKGNGASLLLYKDARVDMAVLDETVGPFNWQCAYSRDNANCTVSIWDAEKNQWIAKEDVGVPSNAEAEKGLASDSFKRACFKWGIGRELYETPFIWVKGLADKYAKLYCSIFEVVDGKVVKLEIRYKDDDQVAFRWKGAGASAAPAPARPARTATEPHPAVDEPKAEAPKEEEPKADDEGKVVSDVQFKIGLCENVQELRELYTTSVEAGVPQRALDYIKAAAARIKGA